MSDPLSRSDLEQTYQRNLSAIRQIDPELAQRLDGVDVPEQAELTTGRDGSPTYCVRGQESDRWLGMTSMPTVSGPATLGNFDAGSGNVALAGIGQGIEARLLVDQLALSRAVFILEPDPTSLAMALRLHDLSAALAARRVILIVPTDADADAPVAPLFGALLRYLEQHAGVMPPERMLAWPWLSPTQTDLVRIILQRASTEITQRRARDLASLSSELAGHYPERSSAMPTRPTTLVVCLNPSAETCQVARELTQGAASLDWVVEPWLGDTPDRSTSLPLGHTIAEQRPDWVVLIDSVRGRLARVLPAGLPVVTWLTPWAQVDGDLVSGVGPGDRVAAMTDRAARRVAEAGLDAERVHVVPPGAMVPESYEPPPATYEVLTVSNAMTTDAEANGLTLDSHRALWHAAWRLIVDEAERYCDEHIEALLSRAEKRAGAAFQDPALRANLQRHINAVLGQTLVRREAYAAALRSGVPLTVRGRGWGDVEGIVSAWGGPIGTSARSAVYGSAKIVLHVDIAGNTTPDLLGAATSGAAVVARAHPSDQAPHGLTKLLEPGREILFFRRHSEMVGHIKRLLADEPARREMAERARTKLAEAHTVSHRLQALRKLAATES